MRVKQLMISLSALLSAGLVACSGGRQANVTVVNGLSVPRDGETVEVLWQELGEKIAGLTADNVIVSNAKGEQIPSQVIYAGEEAPQSLIFQVSVAEQDSAVYTVTTGVRNPYKAKAYGRFVPERKDDYAWENNRVAFRLYGPALEELLVTSGIDYWAKSTPELIIDSWYHRDLSGGANFHIDLGEGCDCYDVGPTPGMGASAPYAGGKLWPSRNFTNSETLDNGPIRTTVRLTYAPFDVDGTQIALVKIISLDANTHFNKMTDLYSGSADTLSVAAGIAIHKGAQLYPDTASYALYEPSSDPQSGDGISLGGAVVMPRGVSQRLGDVAACVGTAHAGQPFVYYAGAATSRQGITAADWVRIVADWRLRVEHPLTVRVE